MTQEERQIFEEDLKKFKKGSIYVLIGLLVLFLFFNLKSCNNNQYQQLKGKYDLLEVQYNNQKKLVSVIETERKKQSDSLKKEIIKRENQNKKLLITFNKIEKSIQEIKSKPIIVPKDTEGLVKYFNNRYKTNENKIVENKIGLTENIAYDVSYELEQGDNVAEISKLQQNQIENQSNQISNLEKDKQDVKIQLSLTEQENESRKSLLKLADENIETLEKQVKKANTRSTLNKVLIPVAFIGGGFIGYQIAK